MATEHGERYRAKLPHRGRGLAELTTRAGDVVADIRARLARREPVRVLELGCGYGTALLELRQRFGGRVELHGITREARDADPAELRAHAARLGLAGPFGGAADDVPMPAIAIADVAAGLPYASDRFDVVFSQVAWLYFGNKIGVLREVCRVLAADGIARIDADELDPKLPPEYRRLVEIWDDGRILPLADYLAAHGMALVAAAEGHYLRVNKATSIGEDLVPVAEVDTARLFLHWDGVKCVYRRIPR